MELSESRRRPTEENDSSPLIDHREELLDGGVGKSIESSRHRSKDKKKIQREEKDPRDKDRERLKEVDVLKEREKEHYNLERDRASSRERRREDRDEREKYRIKGKVRDRDYEREKYRDKGCEKDKDRKDHGKERDRGKERELEQDVEWSLDKEWVKEKGRDKDKERHKEKDRLRDRERVDERGKDHEKDIYRASHEMDRGKGKINDRERERDDKERSHGKKRHKDRDKVASKSRDGNGDGARDEPTRLDVEGTSPKPRKVYDHYRDELSNIEQVQKDDAASSAIQFSTTEFGERIAKMKEDRIKNKSTSGSEISAWVSKSRQLEEKRKAEKAKALQLSRVFEEQDKVDQEESEDGVGNKHTADLAGIKVLHGLDKVAEGGAVVLTLKDQNILADGGINEGVDMLENVEIGEQKQRDEAYVAAKKKSGPYFDKFGDEFGSEKKILSQYDDPVADEGVTLDERGQFSSEVEKRLEELRRRIHGVSVKTNYEDLNLFGRISSDYYTQEEMLRFKKPKKKKSLRKKDKLDIDALEAEAVSAGLGAGDLGSRRDARRQAIQEEKERMKADMRNTAYQSAYAKADEASQALRQEQTFTVQLEDENPVFGNDDDDLSKSLERARRLALQEQNEEAISGPKAVALLASVTGSNQNKDDPSSTSGETPENKVIFTEMEEFVWGLQLDQETEKPDSEDVFMEEDAVPKVSEQEFEGEDGGWKEINDAGKDEAPTNEPQEEIIPDEIIHEAEVGKGLSGALHLLKERGALKDSVDWGGRNMDKKKSKLVGLHNNDGTKEIRIERTDEFGRILTPKEAFRILSHRFHGKGPGKMKQEKHLKQYYEELKLKQMKNSDTPSLSVERMREAQARMKTPYIVLSGHVKPGQSSDPKSGFATVEKELPGGLTPMLGDRKVEHFLGIKRKSDGGGMDPPKRPRN